MRKLAVTLLALSLLLLGGAQFLAIRSSRPAPRRVIMPPLSFTHYAAMHSGYRDADGARMSAFLQCWKEQTLQWARANGKQDAVAALAGRYTTDDALDALPPSAQNFWRAASRVDWLSIYDIENIGEEWERRLWLPSRIKPFKEFDPGWLDILREDFSDSPDEQYYQYNTTQSWAERLSDFENLLVYSDEDVSVVNGEICGEQSLDGERQFKSYDSHRGQSRYKSFAHLLATFYLTEYQQVHGRDRSLGHIYHFRGDWAKTCIPLLFDADEIASWQAGRLPASGLGELG